MYVDEFHETALQPQFFLILQSEKGKVGRGKEKGGRGRVKKSESDSNAKKSRVNLQCGIKSLWRNRFAHRRRKGRQNGLARKTNLKLISSDTGVRAHFRSVALLLFWQPFQPSVSNLHIITVVTGDVNRCNSTLFSPPLIDSHCTLHVKTAKALLQ